MKNIINDIVNKNGYGDTVMYCADDNIYSVVGVVKNILIPNDITLADINIMVNIATSMIRSSQGNMALSIATNTVNYNGVFKECEKQTLTIFIYNVNDMVKLEEYTNKYNKEINKIKESNVELRKFTMQGSMNFFTCPDTYIKSICKYII